MGKLYAVGFGPGGYEYMTQRCIDVIRSADVITGYTTYIDLLKPFFPDKEYISTPMKKEIDRCRMAIELAESGKNVAMVSSGDSGIYGMAGILLEMKAEMNADVEIETVSGITAASAAAAILGAPLMHDFTIISLSDLMTPLDLIMKRVDYLKRAADILMKYRDGSTPVGVVRDAGREDQTSYITTLDKIGESPVDMFSIVIVGNSNTYVKDGKMITPRGYQDKYGYAADGGKNE